MTRMANSKNSPKIWIRIEWCKRINHITVLKNTPLLIPTTAKLTEFEIGRNKKISKIRYIVEQYFGISHMYDNAKQARFPDIVKNKFDGWYRQAARPLNNTLKMGMR